MSQNSHGFVAQRKVDGGIYLVALIEHLNKVTVRVRRADKRRLGLAEST